MKKIGAKFFMVLILFSVMPSSAITLKEQLAEVLKKKEYENGRDVCAEFAKLFSKADDLGRKNLFLILDFVNKDDLFMSKDSLPLAVKNLDMLKTYGRETVLSLENKAPHQFDEIDCFAGGSYSNYTGEKTNAWLFEKLCKEALRKQKKQKRDNYIIGGLSIAAVVVAGLFYKNYGGIADTKTIIVNIKDEAQNATESINLQ